MGARKGSDRIAEYAISTRPAPRAGTAVQSVNESPPQARFRELPTDPEVSFEPGDGCRIVIVAIAWMAGSPSEFRHVRRAG